MTDPDYVLTLLWAQEGPVYHEHLQHLAGSTISRKSLLVALGDLIDEGHVEQSVRGFAIRTVTV